MDLYTLTDTFLADENIDEFTSAIWTERYAAFGDMQIVLPASAANVEKLAPGTRVALRGSDEVMTVETRVIEKNLMTVTGNSLIAFLNERMAWFKNPDSTDADKRVVDFTLDTKKPGEFISYVVGQMVVSPASFGVGYTLADLDWLNEDLPGLALGAIDTSGSVKRLTLPIGPLYDAIAQIAAAEGVGMSMYLESAHPVDGYVIKFKTYRGVDHSTGGAGELVRLTPDLDSLNDVKEVASINGYKNVVYVYYDGEISEHIDPLFGGEPEGWERRTMLVETTEAPVGHAININYGYGVGNIYTAYIVDPGDVTAYRNQNAADALANHNYVRAIDGQTSPDNQFQYGTHYGLGDILELEGLTGEIAKSRVTEYIRTQDKNGSREYPTITVVNS